MTSLLLKNGLFILRQCISKRKSLKYQSVINSETLYNLYNLTTFRSVHLSPFLEKIVSFNLSDIGEGIREVTIKEWFVKEGDVVEQFDNLCEVQSDKASVTITSRYDGKIVKIHHKIDEIAYVGKPLLDFDVEDEETEESDSDTEKSLVKNEIKEKDTIKKENSQNLLSNNEDESENDTKGRIKVLATPAVRRIAMENKVDLSKVSATGKLGRVLKGDVLEYLGQVPLGTNKPHPTLLVQEKKIPIVDVTSDRVEILKGIRKAMMKSMTETLKIPHFAYSDEIDMTNLIQLRNNLLEETKRRDVSKLTFMPFCIKAASLALKQYPILNSTLDLENESVKYKRAHNISVAIDTPDGLVVPNVKNCQNKSILQIAKDLQELLERARNSNLKPEDFADGTFSLSNIGIIGGTYTHPCILPPQVAIGAIGKTKLVPRFDENGNLIKAHIMCVSWSADHRIIDGVTMAKFSNLWKNYLENPTLFLLE